MTLIPVPVIVGIRFLTTGFSKAAFHLTGKKDKKYYATALDIALKRRGVKKKEREKIIQEVFGIRLKR